MMWSRSVDYHTFDESKTPVHQLKWCRRSLMMLDYKDCTLAHLELLCITTTYSRLPREPHGNPHGAHIMVRSR